MIILIDDTTTHNFFNYNLVKKLKLPQIPSSHKYIVSLANGYDKDEWDTVVNQVQVKIQEYEAFLDFQVMCLSTVDAILGREWLFSMGETLSRSYLHNTLTFEHKEKFITLE